MRIPGKADVAVRMMRAEEAARLAEITRACPEAAPWNADGYAQLLNTEEAYWDGRGAAVLVAECAGNLAGFLAVRAVADEVEILNLAVASAARRQGLGSALLETAFSAALRAGARAAFCEVRESNTGAQSFYARHGFKRAGRRLRYYSSPVEDALVLWRKLGNLKTDAEPKTPSSEQH
jgi:ribosomal-protein-alanine N-acetyltransferase